ncbi:MAG: DNA translocase FtsK, partial [Candidatus Auribacterota bacterium]|nr:DNA translocase FtsK [Candidatus Auribacterota bacterium]
PLIIGGEGINRLIPHNLPLRPNWVRAFYELLIVAGFSPLLTLQSYLPPQLLGPQLENMTLGGWWGILISRYLLLYLGEFGTRLVLVTVVMVSLALLTEMKPFLWFAHQIQRASIAIAGRFSRRRKEPWSKTPPSRSRVKPDKTSAAARKTELQQKRQSERAVLLKKREEELLRREKLRENEDRAREREREKEERRREKEREREEKESLLRQKEKQAAAARGQVKPKAAKVRKKPSRPGVSRASASAPLTQDAGGPDQPYRLPPLDILDIPPLVSERGIKDVNFDDSAILVDTLAEFGIESSLVGIEQGPAITRYELQIAPGVKVGKVKALDNDLALTMKAKSVRILAPIPGKAAIGIEVPNVNTSLVSIHEMIDSPEFKKKRLQLPLAIGKDISGTPIVADLVAMPHLLIAGATGSGKTVCINSIIVSLLYARTPDELKLIMVDPKKVEMAAFHRLPHLLCPVITSAAKAAMALAWVIKEMEDRYDYCARAGVRNIQSYNSRPTPPSGEESVEEGGIPAHMPYIVLIIDELADLMLVAAKEIETSIARLAHLSRAVGIHLILATQRPSVDVVTGIIKANLPGRISFKVSAKVDSRTVLDAGGADKLLGSGDLLFLPPGTDQLVRAQGTYCQDHEIDDVVAFVTRQRRPEFEKDIFQKKGPAISGSVGGGGGGDIFLESAIDVIKQTDQASVSMLQRKLKIGYSRAARIMDELEEMGVVGPYRGTKAREILIGTYAGDGTAEAEEEEEDE